MIPKIVHFVWVGKKIPSDRLRKINAWTKLNPEFQIVLWMDELGTNNNAMYGNGYAGAVSNSVTDRNNSKLSCYQLVVSNDETILPQKGEIVFHVKGQNITVNIQGVAAFLVSQDDPAHSIIMQASTKLGANTKASCTSDEALAISRSASLNNCIPSRVEIQDIASIVNGSPLFPFIRYEIDRIIPNYGAASDLIRLGILFAIGGFYYDSDVAPVDLIKINFGQQEESKAEDTVFMSTLSANDIIVCNPKNKIIEKMIAKALDNYRLTDPQKIGELYAATYLSDNPFYVVSSTMTKTGPNLIRGAGVEEKITEIPKLRSVANPESEQSWCFRGAKTLEDAAGAEILLNSVLKQINFELEETHILRLESHWETFLAAASRAIEKQGIPILLTRFIKGIELLLGKTRIEFIQCSFRYPELADCYQRNNFLQKSGIPFCDSRWIPNQADERIFNESAYRDMFYVFTSDFTTTLACASELRICLSTMDNAQLTSTLVGEKVLPKLATFLEYFSKYLTRMNIGRCSKLLVSNDDKYKPKEEEIIFAANEQGITAKIQGESDILIIQDNPIHPKIIEAINKLDPSTTRIVTLPKEMQNQFLHSNIIAGKQHKVLQSIIEKLIPILDIKINFIGQYCEAITNNSSAEDTIKVLHKLRKLYCDIDKIFRQVNGLQLSEIWAKANSIIDGFDKFSEQEADLLKNLSKKLNIAGSQDKEVSSDEESLSEEDEEKTPSPSPQ